MMQERFKDFTVLISNISRNIKRIKADEMAKFNLKSNHLPSIYYLYNFEKLTLKELCDICTEDKANMSRSLKFLEENDYIIPCNNNSKRYQCYFKLTEKGYEVGDFLIKRVDEILNNISTVISEDEREIMYKCLRLINRSIQNIE